MTLPAGVAALLEIQQGATVVIYAKNIRDYAGAVLDPTGWTIRAAARQNPQDGVILAAWSSTPAGIEGSAVVGDPEPAPGETVTPGEKWIFLHVTPAMSRAWTWSIAWFDIHMTEPAAPFREVRITEPDTRLFLKHTTVR